MRIWTGRAFGGVLVLALRRCLLLVSFCFWMFLTTTIANASPPPDLLLLRNVVCSYETRGEKDPDDAVGSSGELGACQILPGTARQVGYKGKNRDLFDHQVNEYWALVKLAACARKYVTVRGLAWCYHRGLSAGRVNVHDPYVVAVWRAYRDQERKVVEK